MTTLIAFLFALGVLVFVHELGHYLVARWCGVKILRFSIGFGKPLLTWKVGKDQTEWSLSPIPLGGYVRMLDEEEGGEIDPAEVHRAFNRLPLLKRSAVVIAGPAANFLLAIVLYAVLGMAGLQEPAPVLATPPAGTAAASAGIQEGERVLTVDGHAVQSFSEMRLKMIDPIVERRPIVLEVEGPDGRHHRSIPTSGLPAGELERDFTRTLGVDLKAGLVQVASVEEGSAAARAGLQLGDQVLRVNGQPISRAQQLIQQVRASDDTKHGKEVRLGHFGGAVHDCFAQPGTDLDNLVGFAPVDCDRVEGGFRGYRGICPQPRYVEHVGLGVGVPRFLAARGQAVASAHEGIRLAEELGRYRFLLGRLGCIGVSRCGGLRVLLLR